MEKYCVWVQIKWRGETIVNEKPLAKKEALKLRDSYLKRGYFQAKIIPAKRVKTFENAIKKLNRLYRNSSNLYADEETENSINTDIFIVIENAKIAIEKNDPEWSKNTEADMEWCKTLDDWKVMDIYHKWREKFLKDQGRKV